MIIWLFALGNAGTIASVAILAALTGSRLISAVMVALGPPMKKVFRLVYPLFENVNSNRPVSAPNTSLPLASVVAVLVVPLGLFMDTDALAIATPVSWFLALNVMVVTVVDGL